MSQLKGILAAASVALAAFGAQGKTVPLSQSSESTPVRYTRIIRVSGQRIGGTLVPRAGETKQSYEERLNLLNEMTADDEENHMPAMSIFTKKGRTSYIWGKKLSQKSGTYNPSTDPILKMVDNMLKGKTTQLYSITPEQGAGIRRGKTYDF